MEESTKVESSDPSGEARPVKNISDLLTEWDLGATSSSEDDGDDDGDGDGDGDDGRDLKEDEDEKGDDDRDVYPDAELDLPSVPSYDTGVELSSFYETHHSGGGGGGGGVVSHGGLTGAATAPTTASQYYEHDLDGIHRTMQALMKEREEEIAMHKAKVDHVNTIYDQLIAEIEEKRSLQLDFAAREHQRRVSTLDAKLVHWQMYQQRVTATATASLMPTMQHKIQADQSGGSGISVAKTFPAGPQNPASRYAMNGYHEYFDAATAAAARQHYYGQDMSQMTIESSEQTMDSSHRRNDAPFAHTRYMPPRINHTYHSHQSKSLHHQQQHQHHKRHGRWGHYDDTGGSRGMTMRQPIVLGEARIARRRRQIEKTKAKIGYQNYIKCVPAKERRSEHPRTPDEKEPISKRRFEGKMRKWRYQIHEWDDVVVDRYRRNHVSRAMADVEAKSITDDVIAMTSVIPPTQSFIDRAQTGPV